MISAFSKQVRELIYSRDQGRCVLCGMGGEFQYHHRQPRGQGGSKDPRVGQAANGILLHAHCHERVERDRFISKVQGFLVSRNGIQTPEDVPIHHAVWGWVLLDNQGGWERIEKK